MLEAKVVAMLTTKNEEANLRAAVESIVTLTKDILIIDSYSTDNTCKVAAELEHELDLDLELVVREYVSPSAQKNWGIDHICRRHDQDTATPYILILDADERLTPQLVTEIRKHLKQNRADCYYLPRANHFMGQFIKHSNWYPDYCLRLFRAGKAYYEDVRVHEHMIPDGRVTYLKCPIIHNTYTSISQYTEKLNRYTDWELDNFGAAGEVLSRMGRKRRIFAKLPLRPLIRGVYMYFFRLGFLDGRRGFQLAVLSGIYEYIVNLKRSYQISDTGTNPDPGRRDVSNCPEGDMQIDKECHTYGLSESSEIRQHEAI